MLVCTVRSDGAFRCGMSNRSPPPSSTWSSSPVEAPRSLCVAFTAARTSAVRVVPAASAFSASAWWVERGRYTAIDRRYWRLGAESSDRSGLSCRGFVEAGGTLVGATAGISPGAANPVCVGSSGGWLTGRDRLGSRGGLARRPARSGVGIELGVTVLMRERPQRLRLRVHLSGSGSRARGRRSPLQGLAPNPAMRVGDPRERLGDLGADLPFDAGRGTCDVEQDDTEQFQVGVVIPGLYQALRDTCHALQTGCVTARRDHEPSRGT